MDDFNIEEKHIIPIFGLPGRRYSGEEISRIEILYRKLFLEMKEKNCLRINVDFKYEPDELLIKGDMMSFGMPVLDSFTQSEIAFCIGHEVAHFLYQHDTITCYLEKISACVNKNILDLTGKECKSDAFFMQAIRKRFEYEADLLGACLANKADYCSEISALEKMDEAIHEFKDILDEHPLIPERIHRLKSVPYPSYNEERIRKEFLYIKDMYSKTKQKVLSPEDLKALFLMESQYIIEAHIDLVQTDYFLRSRRYYVQNIFSHQLTCGNYGAANAFYAIFNYYDKQCSGCAARIPIGFARQDVEHLLETLKAIQRGSASWFRIPIGFARQDVEHLLESLKAIQREPACRISKVLNNIVSSFIGKRKNGENENEIESNGKQISYSELDMLQHKLLPLMFLVWKEGTVSKAKNFPLYVSKITSSFDESDFSVVQNDKKMQYPIERYLQGKETVFCFSFPVKETPQYLGLAKQAFIAFHKKTFTLRLFLWELDRWFNGECWYPHWNIVEYIFIDTAFEEYRFIRKVYR